MDKEDLYQEGIICILQVMKDGIPDNPNFETIIGNKFINLSKSAAWGLSNLKKSDKEIDLLEDNIESDFEYLTSFSGSLSKRETYVLILKALFKFSNTQISDLTGIKRQKIDEIISTMKNKINN